MTRSYARPWQTAMVLALGCWGLAAGVSPARADAAADQAQRDRVTRVHRLEVAEATRLTLVNSVGDIEVRLGEGPDVEVEVTIKSSRRNWFSARPDVSKVDIDITRRGGQLRLALDEDNVSGRWLVTLPKKDWGLIEINAGVGDIEVEARAAKLEIDLGVGEVNARLTSGIIDVDVGVGDIKVFTGQASAGNIQGSVGVGEVTITGEGVNARGRGVVRIGAAGGGDKDITASAGVGDIEIVLTRP